MALRGVKWFDQREVKVVREVHPGDGWDKRLQGAMSPCTAYEANGMSFVAYVGAEGHRSDDGGPLRRRLGALVGPDCLNVEKWSGNPALQHPRSGGMEEEEGIFSVGSWWVGPDLHLCYGGMDKSGAGQVRCQGFVVIAKNGGPPGPSQRIISVNQQGMHGTYDEMFPVGGYALGSTVYVFYLTKVPPWAPGGDGQPLDLAVAKFHFHNGRYQFSGQSWKVLGGKGDEAPNTCTDVVQLADNRYGFVLGRGNWKGHSRYYEIFEFSPTSPWNVRRVGTYRSWPGFRNLALRLDRSCGRWCLYIERETAPNQSKILVASAPLRYA